jgi:hypothetical protein
VTAACRLTADDLRLEAVRRDVFRVVLEEVDADRLDSRGRSRDRVLGRVLLLDGLALLVGAVGEDAVEELVEGVAEHAELGQAALVEDRAPSRRPSRPARSCTVSMYPPKVWSVLLSFLSIGVPVKPKKTAFGRATRRLAASEPYCVRWASSVSTKRFSPRSGSGPA